MPWPLFRRREEQQGTAVHRPTKRETLQAQGIEGPIYSAHGSGKFNKFDQFLQRRDEEGETDEMDSLKPIERRGSCSVNPAVEPEMKNALSKDRVDSEIRQWPMTDPRKAYNKEPAMGAPVFETHSFFSARTMEEFGKMHSFIGLRYTEVNDGPESKIYGPDPENARGEFVRKRMVIGYGALGATHASERNRSRAAKGAGRLMDDSGHKVTASTQTPIDSYRARALLDAIPKFHGEFNYNLVTSNCNDFARTMSRLVGVRAAAELYDHPVLGPVTAAGDIKSSAGKQLEGGTVVYETAKESYDRAPAETSMANVIAAFQQDAESAIRQDGGQRKLGDLYGPVQEFVDELMNVDIMFQFVKTLHRDLEYDEELKLSRDMQDEFQRMITRAHKLTSTSSWKKHVHTNQVIWKLIKYMEKEQLLLSANIMDCMRRVEEGASRLSQRAAAAAPVPPAQGSGTASAQPMQTTTA